MLVQDSNRGFLPSRLGPALGRARTLGPPCFQEPVQILTLESEAASVPELRRRDRTLPCSPADRLVMHTEVSRRLWSPKPRCRLTHGISVTKCDRMNQAWYGVVQCARLSTVEFRLTPRS